MKTELTKEQSQHLIDLGVPKEKASRTETIKYGQVIAKDSLGNSLSTIGEYAPIFTLTDLLEILPKEIDNNHSLNICYIRNQWWTEYISYITEEAIVQKEGIELIDALYELCAWCLKNNYLKY